MAVKAMNSPFRGIANGLSSLILLIHVHPSHLSDLQSPIKGRDGGSLARDAAPPTHGLFTTNNSVANLLLFQPFNAGVIHLHFPESRIHHS